jgi:hypothetical protein
MQLFRTFAIMNKTESKPVKNKAVPVMHVERGPYLTKRILISATKKGFKQAAEETMRVMGYNVVAKDGWVVKIFPDGTTEKISPIEQIELPNDKWFD